MKKIITCLFITALSMLLTDCAANIGNTQISDVGRFMSLQKGKSDKREVYGLFSQPHEVAYVPSASGSYWEYYNTQMTISGATFVPFIGLIAGGYNADTTIATFYFDSQDLFQKIETKNHDEYVNQWVGISKQAHELSTDTKHLRVEAEMKKYNLPFDPKVAEGVKDIGIFTK
jgi:hypothetical protein